MPPVAGRPVDHSPIESSTRQLRPNTAVSVFVAGTTNLATLYANEEATVQRANPYTTDALGNPPTDLFLLPGAYEESVGGGNKAPISVSIVDADIMRRSQAQTVTGANDFTGADGLKYKGAVVSRVKEGLLSLKDPRIDALGDGTAEAAKIQAALDMAASVGRGGGVFAPYGRYGCEAQIAVAAGVHFLAEGAYPFYPEAQRGTVLEAVGTLNTDLLAGKQVDVVADPWNHGTVIEGFHLQARTGQTVGNGLRITLGENSEVRNCSGKGFPEASFCFQGAQTPGRASLLTSYASKYGVWMKDPGSAYTHRLGGTMVVDGLSGDDNDQLVYISNATTNTSESGQSLCLVLQGIKAELAATAGTKHDPVILASNLNEGTIIIVGGSAVDFSTTPTANKALVKITGTTGHVLMHGPWVDNYPRLLDDVVTGKVILTPAEVYPRYPHPGLIAHRVYSHIDGESYTNVATPLPNGWVALANNTPARYWKDPFGMVRLGGTVDGGVNGSTIFTLPTGYRPDFTQRFPVASDAGYRHVDVNPDGTVIFRGSETGVGYIDLASVQFRAA